MHRCNSGFTLVELVVVLAIASILSAMALPGLQALLERSRSVSTQHQIVAAFAHARLLAITRQRPATVCPSFDGSGCREDGIWEDGWITFQDHNGNGDRDPVDEVMKRELPVGDALHIRSSQFRSRALFRRNGMAQGANFTLRICSLQGRVLSALILNNAGRVRQPSLEQVAALPPC